MVGHLRRPKWITLRPPGLNFVLHPGLNKYSTFGAEKHKGATLKLKFEGKYH